MLCFYKIFEFPLILMVPSVQLAQILLLFVSVDNSVHFSSKLNLKHLIGCVRSTISCWLRCLFAVSFDFLTSTATDTVLAIEWTTTTFAQIPRMGVQRG